MDTVVAGRCRRCLELFRELWSELGTARPEDFDPSGLEFIQYMYSSFAEWSSSNGGGNVRLSLNMSRTLPDTMRRLERTLELAVASMNERRRFGVTDSRGELSRRLSDVSAVMWDLTSMKICSLDAEAKARREDETETARRLAIAALRLRETELAVESAYNRTRGTHFRDRAEHADGKMRMAQTTRGILEEQGREHDTDEPGIPAGSGLPIVDLNIRR